MTELTHKIEDLKKIIGPHGTGASVKNTKYLDLLVYKYQLEENDKKQNIKRPEPSKKYYRAEYRKILTQLKTELRLLEERLRLLKHQSSTKDYNAKHAAYIGLIKLLLGIKFNPLGVLASVVNGIIWVINQAIKYLIVIPLSFLIDAIIMMISAFNQNYGFCIRNCC